MYNPKKKRTLFSYIYNPRQQSEDEYKKRTYKYWKTHAKVFPPVIPFLYNYIINGLFDFIVIIMGLTGKLISIVAQSIFRRLIRFKNKLVGPSIINFIHSKITRMYIYANSFSKYGFKLRCNIIYTKICFYTRAFFLVERFNTQRLAKMFPQTTWIINIYIFMGKWIARHVMLIVNFIKLISFMISKNISLCLTTVPQQLFPRLFFHFLVSLDELVAHFNIFPFIIFIGSLGLPQLIIGLCIIRYFEGIFTQKPFRIWWNDRYYNSDRRKRTVRALRLTRIKIIFLFFYTVWVVYWLNSIV